jgi:hypothetical protein
MGVPAISSIGMGGRTLISLILILSVGFLINIRFTRSAWSCGQSVGINGLALAPTRCRRTLEF